MRINDKLKTKILKTLYKSFPQNETPNKVMTSNEFNQIKDLTLKDDIASKITLEESETLEISKMLNYKDIIIIVSTVIKENQPQRSIISLVLNTSFQIINQWSEITYNLKPQSISPIKNLFIDTNGDFLILWQKVEDESYQLIRLNDVLNNPLSNKLLAITFSNFYNLKAINTWLFNDDEESNTYYIVYTPKENKLVKILQLSYQDETWKEEAIEPTSSPNWEKNISSLQFISDKDGYVLTFVEKNNEDPEENKSVQSQKEFWYSEEELMRVKQELIRIGAKDVVWEILIPQNTNNRYVKNYNFTGTARSVSYTYTWDSKWSGCFISEDRIHPDESLEWKRVDNNFNENFIEIKDEGTLGFKGSAREFSVSFQDEYPSNTWVEDKRATKLRTLIKINKFLSNGQWTNSFIWQQVSYNQRAREFLKGEKWEGSQPGNSPNFSDCLGIYVTSYGPTFSRTFSTTLKVRVTYTETISVPQDNRFTLWEIKKGDQNDLASTKVFEIKDFASIGEVLRPSKNKNFLVNLIYDFSKVTSQALLNIAYVQNQWTFTYEPTNLTSAQSINLDYTFLNNQQSIIGGFQFVNNYLNTILYYKNKEDLWILDKTVTSTKEINFKTKWYLLLNEANFVKFFAFNEDCSKVIEFTNSYDNSDETSTPYFFLPYNNQDEDFSFQRIAALGDLKEGDINIKDYSSSENILVFTSSITKNVLNNSTINNWQIISNTNNWCFDFDKKVFKNLLTEVNLSFVVNTNVIDNTNNLNTLQKKASTTLNKLFIDQNNEEQFKQGLVKVKILFEDQTFQTYNLDQEYFSFDSVKNELYFNISVLNIKKLKISYIILLNEYDEEFFKYEQEIKPQYLLNLSVKIYFKEN